MSQYARPSQDVGYNSNWVPSDGSSWYGVLDESSPDDDDYVREAAAVGTATMEVILSAVDAPSDRTNHIARVRYRRNSSLTATFTFYLYEGASLRHSQSISPTSTNYATSTIAIPTTAAELLSDYSDLRFRFSAPSTNPDNPYISWVELEVPDAPSSIEYDQAVSGALSLSGAITKQGEKALEGAFSPGGVISRAAHKLSSGTLEFAALLETSRLYAWAVAGALSLSGAISKQGKKALAGIQGLSGSVIKGAARSLAGGAGISGAVSRQVARSFSGAWGQAGTLARKTQAGISGALSWGGTLSRGAGKMISGALTGAGALARKTGKAAAGTISAAGQVSRGIKRALGGTLGLSGVETDIFKFIVVGALGFSGSLMRLIYGATPTSRTFIPAAEAALSPGARARGFTPAARAAFTPGPRPSIVVPAGTQSFDPESDS